MPQSDSTPTTSQLKYLADLQLATGRRFQQPPKTRAEASERIRRLQKAPRTATTGSNPEAPATDRQIDYIRKLSRSRGLRFAAPRTQAAASLQIAALKAVPTGRYERLIERDLKVREPVAAAVAVREHEVHGYGSSATWRGGDA